MGKVRTGDVVHLSLILAIVLSAGYFDNIFAQTCAIILIALDAILLGVVWLMTARAGIEVRRALAKKSIDARGSVRLINYILNISFKTVTTITAIYFHAPITAVLLILSLIFEEHGVAMIEKSLK